jgi:hypothetical protein
LNSFTREPLEPPPSAVIIKRSVSSDFDSYPLKMGLKAALCRRKTWI